MRCLVACTFDETIASFSPRKSFNKVLLPALGLPKIFTKPAFKSLWFVVCSLLKCPIEFLQYKSATQWKRYAYSSAGLKIIQIKKSCFMTGPLPCCEGGIRTSDLRVMSPTSYHCSTSRFGAQRYGCATYEPNFLNV